MQSNEIIVVDSIPKDSYIRIVEKSLKYALISQPFTINRMGIDSIENKVLNITKGKIAEGIFEFFCNSNDIQVNFKSCETPFWTIDKRDFIFDGLEWDIKNNFFYSEKDVEIDCSTLPALIPNRHPKDQWSKRNKSEILQSNGIAYVFTFMKMANIQNGKRTESFIEIDIPENCLRFLDKKNFKYLGQPQKTHPQKYEEEFNTIFSTQAIKDIYKINSQPNLFITGYATQEDWIKFKDTGKNAPNNFIDFLPNDWYRVNKTGSITFPNNVLTATIKNATLPVSYLRPFSKLLLKRSFRYSSFNE